jgi:hypothetical protein
MQPLRGRRAFNPNRSSPFQAYCVARCINRAAGFGAGHRWPCRRTFIGDERLRRLSMDVGWRDGTWDIKLRCS